MVAIEEIGFSYLYFFLGSGFILRCANYLGLLYSVVAGGKPPFYSVLYSVLFIQKA
jgi:hypothetical protein